MPYFDLQPTQSAHAFAIHTHALALTTALLACLACENRSAAAGAVPARPPRLLRPAQQTARCAARQDTSGWLVRLGSHYRSSPHTTAVTMPPYHYPTPQAPNSTIPGFVPQGSEFGIPTASRLGDYDDDSYGARGRHRHRPRHEPEARASCTIHQTTQCKLQQGAARCHMHMATMGGCI